MTTPPFSGMLSDLWPCWMDSHAGWSRGGKRGALRSCRIYCHFHALETSSKHSEHDAFRCQFALKKMNLARCRLMLAGGDRQVANRHMNCVPRLDCVLTFGW